eukprot:76080-Pyramimonas_sp.AAC.1
MALSPLRGTHFWDLNSSSPDYQAPSIPAAAVHPRPPPPPSSFSDSSFSSSCSSAAFSLIAHSFHSRIAQDTMRAPGGPHRSAMTPVGAQSKAGAVGRDWFRSGLSLYRRILDEKIKMRDTPDLRMGGSGRM